LGLRQKVEEQAAGIEELEWRFEKPEHLIDTRNSR
jgi:hypothetical protein